MKWEKIAMYFLGTLVVIGFFVILYVVFRTEMPEKNKEIGLLVIGALVAKFSDVIGYFFGSSKSSADKTDMINQKRF